MRRLCMMALSVLALVGCQKADDAQDGKKSAKSTEAFMSQVLDVINKREAACSAVGEQLGKMAAAKKEDLEALASGYQAAQKAGGEEAKAASKPIRVSRAAINRFSLRCPSEKRLLLGMIDSITGGDVKFAGREPAGSPGGHGSGTGGGGSGGSGGSHAGHDHGAAGGAPIPDGEKPAQTKKPAGDTEVKAPVAADLKGYIADLKGTGKLMARIETTMGKFECVLYDKRAPMTVANFVGLARGLKAYRDPNDNKAYKGDYFTGIIFHRVIPNFMLQTGDPLGKGSGGPGYRFADEFHPELRHDGPGVLSMANAGPTTNGSQFFITEKPTPHLNDRHSVFGKCNNPELIKTIARVAKDPRNRSKPAKNIYISKVTIYRG